MVKVLVIGQGGREHALAWKLSQSPEVQAIVTAPGNSGTARVGMNLNLPVTAAAELATWAAEAAIDLAVVGPEAALATGVVDAFRARGVPIFGPTRAAAKLETSKVWAKDFMTRHHIPTAAYREFADLDEATSYICSLPPEDYPLVVKIDGLAAGKGVEIAQDEGAALRAVRAALGGSGQAGRIVVEQFLRGFEVSFLAISDGITARSLACAHDYKHALEGDRGPMTGGMGAYSPLGSEDRLTEQVMATIISPAIRGMAAEGTPFAGVLYAGLMLTAEGPRVLEFNARLGDPETQVILPRWGDDLYQVLSATVAGKLADLPPFTWSDAAACGVVIAAPGYPAAPAIGASIEGLDSDLPETWVFHGSARPDEQGRRVLTNGGRVLTVVGSSPTLAAARAAAYERVRAIHFQGCWYRRDIGLDEQSDLQIGRERRWARLSE